MKFPVEKIGLFGGTFDPIHLGHLAAAQQAAEALKLSRVWFIPSGSPPHKASAKITPSQLRYQMVRRALAGNPLFRTTDLELKSRGPSYTINSLKAIQRRYPSAELYLLMGLDQAATLSSWKEPETIFRTCRVVVFSRPGFRVSQIEQRWRQRIKYLPIRLLEISASDIRYRVSRNLSIKYLVPQGVERIIQKHNLYRASAGLGLKTSVRGNRE